MLLHPSLLTACTLLQATNCPPRPTAYQPFVTPVLNFDAYDVAATTTLGSNPTWWNSTGSNKFAMRANGVGDVDGLAARPIVEAESCLPHMRFKRVNRMAYSYFEQLAPLTLTSSGSPSGITVALVARLYNDVVRVYACTRSAL